MHGQVPHAHIEQFELPNSCARIEDVDGERSKLLRENSLVDGREALRLKGGSGNSFGDPGRNDVEEAGDESDAG
jgi:hypothetical protein